MEGDNFFVRFWNNPHRNKILIILGLILLIVVFMLIAKGIANHSSKRAIISSGSGSVGRSGSAGNSLGESYSNPDTNSNTQTTNTGDNENNYGCIDTCSNLNFECGAQTICGEEIFCGDCGNNEVCSGGICILFAY